MPIHFAHHCSLRDRRLHREASHAVTLHRATVLRTTSTWQIIRCVGRSTRLRLARDPLSACVHAPLQRAPVLHARQESHRLLLLLIRPGDGALPLWQPTGMLASAFSWPQGS